MATVNEIITSALIEIGAFDPVETVPAADAAFCLGRFQQQIDAWSADRLTIAVTNRVTFSLLSGTNTYTLGTGGQINTARPVWISGANYVVPGTSPAVESPLGQMDEDSYRSLSIKEQTSALPQQFYYRATTALGTLFFWPTVTQNVTIALYLPQGVDQPTALTASMIGPPGYQEAFMYQLALRLCTPYSRPVPPLLPKMAAEAYARMKSPNVAPGLLGVDRALVPGSGGAYNILSDNSTGWGGR
jgi:hypothetical protein